MATTKTPPAPIAAPPGAPSASPLSMPPAPTVAPPNNGGARPAAGQAIKPGRLTRRALGRRLIVNGVEGVGKTSLVSFAPNPLIIMCGSETGYETLMNGNRVPEVDAMHIEKWPELLASLEALSTSKSEHNLIAIDALGGAERMCHQHVCDAQFEGDWSDKGFGSYQRGFDISIGEWLKLLAILEWFKEQGVDVLLLSHVQVRPFKNPMGDDFDQYKSDVHHKTWAVTHKWSDACFFMTFLTDVREKDGKKKGVGGTTRILYTERRDAFDAKNRYGMPPVIQLPDDPAAMWTTLDHYMRNGAQGSK